MKMPITCDEVSYLCPENILSDSVINLKKLIDNDDLKSIKLLYKLGAEIKQDSVVYASSKGKLSIVKYFLDEIQLTHDVDIALKVAVENGHLDMTNYFIRSYDFCGEDFCKILLDACRHNHYNIVEKFYNTVSDSTMENIQNCLDFAIINGNLDMFKFIFKIKKRRIEYKQFKPFLLLACKEGQLDIVKWLMEQEYDLNCFLLNDGLFYAARGKHFEIMKYLISKGATGTPLDQAMYDTVTASLVEIVKGENE